MRRFKTTIVFMTCLYSVFMFSSQKEDKSLDEYPHKITKIPSLFYHATGSVVLFEIGAHGGAPRGPAFFSTVPTRSRYIDLYHRKEKLIRREIQYKLQGVPIVAQLKTLAEEKHWVESQLSIQLPQILSGRGSIIDRYPKPLKKMIRELYRSFGYDALYDQKNKTLVFFEPEKFMRTYAVDILDPPLRGRDNKKIFMDFPLLCESDPRSFATKIQNCRELKLYHLLLYFWCKIQLEDLALEDKDFMKTIAASYKIGYNIFNISIFPLPLEFKNTQKKEKLMDFLVHEDFFWVLSLCSQIDALITSLHR